MVRRQPFDRLPAARIQLINALQCSDSLFSEHFQKFQENLGRSLCIVHSAMMILQRNPQCFRHCIQCMLRLIRQQQTGDSDCIHRSKLTFQFLPPGIFRHKTHIEDRIVSHQYTPLTELQKLRQNLFYHRGIHHVIVTDTCQFLNPKGNGSLRIYKSRKPVCNLPTGNFYCPDFYDFIVYRRKSCRLQVKYHIVPVQPLSFTICNHIFQIIYNIGFHPINNLKETARIRILLSGFLPFRLFRFPEPFPHMIGIGKCLNDAMVCNGNRRMPPLIGPLDQIFCIGHAVHITHLRMTMELHPFLLTVVHPAHRKITDLFHTCNRTYRQFIVKPVNSGHTL